VNFTNHSQQSTRDSLSTSFSDSPERADFLIWNIIFSMALFFADFPDCPDPLTGVTQNTIVLNYFFMIIIHKQFA
jgi:hypothetical protein